MIRRVMNGAAVILAVGGMAFAVVAPASASAAPARAASVSSRSGAAPDFTCPVGPPGAVCTFYGEDLNNAPHVWWPGNKSGKWYNFVNDLGINNPGSLRNNSANCVWLDTQPGGTGGTADPIDGNLGAGVPNLQHAYGWIYITAHAQCGPTPPN